MKFEDFINEGIYDKGIFKAIFFAGNPGSGKTYISQKIKSGQIEPRVVNTDKLFPFFKEFWGSNSWANIKDKVKSTNLNSLVLYINSMLPLFVDGTSSEINSTLRRVGILEGFGYDCGMVFINTSLETALERASKRERRVNPDFIKEAYIKINKAKEYYRTKFNFFVEIKNNDGELTEQVILDAFKKTLSFFNSPIKNPIGIQTKEKMLSQNIHYLNPEIIEIENIRHHVKSWYNT